VPVEEEPAVEGSDDEKSEEEVKKAEDAKEGETVEVAGE
jgi:hypothetical protein